MSEHRFTVVVTRGTVTSAAAESVPRALAWGIARTLRAEGYRVWIVSADFAELFVTDDQSLDEPRAADLPAFFGPRITWKLPLRFLELNCEYLS